MLTPILVPLLLLPLLSGGAGAEASPRIGARGPLADSLEAAAAGLADRSQIGALAVLLPEGDTLLAAHEDRRLILGSNTKIFTTSAFLKRFGPDTRFETRLEARGKVDRKDGRVRFKGDLALRPTGMPDVVPILLPGSRGLLDTLAFQLRASGLERFEGTLWVDGTLFADEAFAPGVALDDIPAGYGASVGAVFANGNAASLVATAGPKRVVLTLEPPGAPLDLVSRVRLGDAGATGWLDVERAPGSRRLVVTGLVPRGGTVKKQVAVPDPDSTAGLWLLGAMRREGIRVDAKVRLVPRVAITGESDEAPRRTGPAEPPPAAPGDTGWSFVRGDRSAVVLVDRSPSAATMAGVVNAVSLNAEAEGLLRHLDVAPREKRRVPGLAEVRRAAAAAGIDTLDLSLVDGSGLSPQNLATARSLVGWLAALARDSSLAEPFRTGLAVPGGTGTLKRRFVGLDPRADLRGKTGTLTNVSSLSGYVETAGGRRAAFAIITNGNRGSATSAKQMEERIVGVISRAASSGGVFGSAPRRIPR